MAVVLNGHSMDSKLCSGGQALLGANTSQHGQPQSKGPKVVRHNTTERSDQCGDHSLRAPRRHSHAGRSSKRCRVLGALGLLYACSGTGGGCYLTICAGISGAGARRSAKPKATAMTTAIASATSTEGDVHPRSGPDAHSESRATESTGVGRRTVGRGNWHQFEVLTNVAR